MFPQLCGAVVAVIDHSIEITCIAALIRSDVIGVLMFFNFHLPRCQGANF